ncbi:MAG TPA: hypothetical protein DCS89_19675, partial [Gammaproteobacteria bacterium]|nr:hypothetical protein [Gammaproteobacteria bacterium]
PRQLDSSVNRQLKLKADCHWRVQPSIWHALYTTIRNQASHDPINLGDGALILAVLATSTR